MPIIISNKNTDHVQVPKVNEVPLVPPPYHIAAAFSKKAALFQQLNQCKSFSFIVIKMAICIIFLFCHCSSPIGFVSSTN